MFASMYRYRMLMGWYVTEIMGEICFSAYGVKDCMKPSLMAKRPYI